MDAHLFSSCATGSPGGRAASGGISGYAGVSLQAVPEFALAVVQFGILGGRQQNFPAAAGIARRARPALADVPVYGAARPGAQLDHGAPDGEGARIDGRESSGGRGALELPAGNPDRATCGGRFADDAFSGPAYAARAGIEGHRCAGDPRLLSPADG